MNFMRDHLNAPLQQVYDALVSGLERFEKKISVSGCSDDELQMVWELIKNNEPQLFFVDFKTFSCVQGMRSRVVVAGYLYSKSESQSMTAKLEQKRAQVLAGYSGSCQADAAEYVHDYLAANVRYDYAAAATHSVPEAVSVAGGLLKEFAVCEGIAKTARYLLAPLGVDAIVVSGIADAADESTGLPGGRHAWNLNLIDGVFYHMDVTWDLKETTPLDRVLHTFCNVDDTSIVMTHDWDMVRYPQAPALTHNYYMRRGCYFKTRVACERYMEQCISRGDEMISIKFDASAGFPDDDGKYMASLVMKALQRLGKAKKLSYVYDCNNTMFTVLLS